MTGSSTAMERSSIGLTSVSCEDPISNAPATPQEFYSERQIKVSYRQRSTESELLVSFRCGPRKTKLRTTRTGSFDVELAEAGLNTLRVRPGNYLSGSH